jgi:hypothetical protein
MESAIKSGKLSVSEMKEMNRCRIVLQAFFVSDITEVNRKCVSPGAITGKRCEYRSITRGWPVQQMPTKWAAWKKLIRIFSQDNTLFEPRGQWATNMGHQ